MPEILVYQVLVFFINASATLIPRPGVSVKGTVVLAGEKVDPETEKEADDKSGVGDDRKGEDQVPAGDDTQHRNEGGDKRNTEWSRQIRLGSSRHDHPHRHDDERGRGADIDLFRNHLKRGGSQSPQWSRAQHRHVHRRANRLPIVRARSRMAGSLATAPLAK